TAWSPAVVDRQPRLSFAFAEPTTIQQLQFATRGTWMRRARPMIHVEAGNEESTQRLTADGLLSLPASISAREVTVTFISVPDEDAPPLAAMELAEVSFLGSGVTGASGRLTADCGSGPPVSVNGEVIPTRAEASRDGWLGIADVHWQACDAATFVGAGDTVSVGSWAGMAPARTLILRDADVLAKVSV